MYEAQFCLSRKTFIQIPDEAIIADVQEHRVLALIDICKGDNVTLQGVTFMAHCFHVQQKQLSVVATCTGIHFAYFIMMVISGWVWNWSNSGTFPLVANGTLRY